MKSLCKTFLSLCILYYLLSCIVSLVSKGHDIHYDILRKKDKVEVSEKLVIHTKKEENSYTLKMTVANETFEYHLMHDFDQKKKIVDDVIFTKDKEYRCILPIFKGNQILTDIICKDSKNQYYNYNSIINPSVSLQKFAKKLEKFGYQSRNYKDQKNEKKKIDLLELYPKNIPNDILFGLTNYKGLYVLKKSQLSNVLLFDQDIYTREISAFVDDYYVVADYNDVYDIKRFFLINLKDGSKKTVTSKTPIASDAYIAGVVGDCVYIIDKSNKKEYQLSVSDESIIEIGNETSNMKYYQNGKWEIVPYTRMTLKNTYFNLFEVTKEGDYHLFLKTGGESTGYSYYYKKVNDGYEIYRSQTGDNHKKMYLFKTDNVKYIKCSKHYIFYQTKNEIKYYSDMTGVRTLLSNSELEFNQDILYGIYEK